MYQQLTFALAESIMAQSENIFCSTAVSPRSCNSLSEVNSSFSSLSSSSWEDPSEHSQNLICLSAIPNYHLDYARSIEWYDFYINGVDHNLDEYDVYKIRVRSSPSRYQPAHNNRQGSVSRGLFDSRCTAASKPHSCVFCKNNGEPLSVYGSHVLKDDCGRVTCPILRRYTCPICSSSGDLAHMLKYCPLNTNRKFHNRRR